MKAKWVAIVFLLVVIIAAATGYGGYSLGMKAGQQRAFSSRQAFLQARGVGGGAGQDSAGFGGGQGIPGFDPSNFASGEIKQISGDTLQLSTTQEVLTVRLTDQTQFQKMATGTASDLQTGERITVQGERAADGSFTATSIQVGPGFGGGMGMP